MKKIIFLFAIISVGLSACKKEPVTPTNKGTIKPNQNTESAKTLHCVPWEDVADPAAAVTDLNALVTCNTSTCTGSPTYFYLNNKIVRDGSGSTWYFLPSDPVTIADQNSIWSDALNQAIAATPTGYSVSSIYNFRLEVAPGTFLIYFMRFDITYVKCTGGGGGGHN